MEHHRRKIPCRPKIKGNVVNITEYGVFIELEKGLEGLVHISEIDWLPNPNIRQNTFP